MGAAPSWAAAAVNGAGLVVVLVTARVPKLPLPVALRSPTTFSGWPGAPTTVPFKVERP